MTGTPEDEKEGRYAMGDQVGPLDGPFSEGLEAVTRLTRSGLFTVQLGNAICAGGEDRAVRAMQREFFPPQTTSTGTGLVLPPDHYHVTFTYPTLPSMTVLNGEFKGGVSGIYDGRRWRKHASVIVAGERSGQNTIWIPAPPVDLMEDSEELIAWGDQQQTEVAPRGYRPIMGQHELIELHRAHPNLCKQFWMAALGSFLLGGDGCRNVGVLNTDGDKPILNDNRFDNRWNDNYRFPFVSKSLQVFINSPFRRHVEEGCFVCRYFCQPPMSFPISLSGMERAAYCL